MNHASPGRSLLVRYRRAAVLMLGMASLLSMPWTAGAQSVQQRLDATAAHLKQLQDLSAKLPASARDKLSSSAQHLLRVAGEWDKIGPQLARSAATLNSSLNGKPFQASGALPPGAVSDPSTDVAFSRMAGFVQSETSTAWCGNTVVVAYNDSGSFLETVPVPNIGLSFNGYSRSTDGGSTFTDLGYLNPGANIFNFLEGDPVVKCTDENTFYYSSIFVTGSSTTSSTGASVSKSTDSGQTFADPVAVVLKDGSFHFIDKPWMAVDPSNPTKLYATYTDFDVEGLFPTSFPNALCPNTIRLGIELVASKDGGATWSTPTVVDNGCFPNEDQGSNVAVDSRGNVYVAWEQFPAFLPTNEIDIAKSTNGGAGFAPKVAVAIVTTVGHNVFGLLQGGFRNNEFPSLAIGTSHGAGTGPIYIAWNDGRNGVKTDGFPPFFQAIYNFGDAFVSRSNDGGASWSAALKVNDDIGASQGIDHYLPAVAVRRDGGVGVCWYDRRRDPENFLIDRECATSTDGGRTWRNTLITKTNFSPIIADDLLVNPVYMGDYDGVAADVLGQSDGFLGAYGNNARGNPDVRISRHFGGTSDSNAQDNNSNN
jgi:hypothetical protein